MHAWTFKMGGHQAESGMCLNHQLAETADLSLGQPLVAETRLNHA